MATCAVDGCEREALKRGVCGACYQQLRFQGRLDEVCPRPAERTCQSCGKTFRPKTLRADVECCSKKCNDTAHYASVRVENTGDCLECGVSLLGHRSDAKFCTEKCNQRWHYKRRDIPGKRLATLPPCEVCGKPIGPKRRIFCSKACLDASHQANIHGITLRHFHEMMEEQGNACAICRKSDWGKKGPVIDHEHDTGQVRGILCNSCNVGIGHLGDTPTLLRVAIGYMEKDHTPMSRFVDATSAAAEPRLVSP